MIIFLHSKTQINTESRKEFLYFLRQCTKAAQRRLIGSAKPLLFALVQVSEQNRIESDWKIIATGPQLAITLKLEPLYSSLKSDQTKDTKMACSINDLLKHTLKQVTFTCPVKCNMVRQSKITMSANKSSPIHRTSQSRTFHSCFLSQQFLVISWTPTNSLWSA